MFRSYDSWKTTPPDDHDADEEIELDTFLMNEDELDVADYTPTERYLPAARKVP